MSVRNIFLCSTLLLYSFTAYSQDNYVDSLKKELVSQKEDTNKVNTLTRLSYAYTFTYADTSIAYGQQSLNLAEKLNFEPGILWSEISLAYTLTISGNYLLALDYGFKSLSLAKIINKPFEILMAQGPLIECYYYLGDYNNSMKYIQETLKLSEQFYKDQIYFIWVDIAMVYERMNQPDSAILYGTKAYKMFRRLPNPNKESLLYPVLGNAFADEANYDSAMVYYRMGISLSTKYYFESDAIDNYNGIADVYRAKGDIDSATWYSKKILIGETGKFYPIGLLKAANMLATIYESQNKPDSTLKYLRMAISLKDSLFNREKTIAIQTITYKEQEKQKEIEAAKVKLKKQFAMYVLLTCLIALLAIAGIILRNKRRRKLQSMRNSIAGDLHDNIGSTLTNIGILSELSKQHLDPKDNANKFLTRISEEVNTTSQALDDIIWSVNVRNDSIDEIILRMRRYAGELFDAGGITYQLKFDDSLSGINLSMNQRRDLYLIFKEAVHNIYKHANASQVMIELTRKQQELIMRIKDDGKGFETKPSHRNGIKNMQSRAQKCRGHLQIESLPCNGTCVNLFFPLK